MFIYPAQTSWKNSTPSPLGGLKRHSKVKSKSGLEVFFSRLSPFYPPTLLAYPFFHCLGTKTWESFSTLPSHMPHPSLGRFCWLHLQRISKMSPLFTTPSVMTWSELPSLLIWVIVIVFQLVRLSLPSYSWFSKTAVILSNIVKSSSSDQIPSVALISFSKCQSFSGVQGLVVSAFQRGSSLSPPFSFASASPGTELAHCHHRVFTNGS